MSLVNVILVAVSHMYNLCGQGMHCHSSTIYSSSQINAFYIDQHGPSGSDFLVHMNKFIMRSPSEHWAFSVAHAI